MNHSSTTPVRFAATLLGLLAIAGCSKPTDSSTVAVVPATNTTAEQKAGTTAEQQAGTTAELRAGSGQFAPPVLLATDEGPIHVESPGYASPCWADVDGDGNKDLLVGQFNGGKIRVYKNLGDQKFAAGEWLQAEGTVAQVPGVW